MDAEFLEEAIRRRIQWWALEAHAHRAKQSVDVVAVDDALVPPAPHGGARRMRPREVFAEDKYGFVRGQHLEKRGGRRVRHERVPDREDVRDRLVAHETNVGDRAIARELAERGARGAAVGVGGE